MADAVSVLSFPDELDAIERDHDEAINEDNLAAEFAASAERTWAIKAIQHALARLYFAGEVRGHNEARRQADDAADALHAAGKLASEPHKTALLRLSARLNAALDRIGHPNKAQMQIISAAAKQIADAIRGETG